METNRGEVLAPGVGFDMDALAEAIDRGDMAALHIELSAMASRAEARGSRLYAQALIAQVLSGLYERGGSRRGSRCDEDAYLLVLREAGDCPDIPSALDVLERFCVSLTGMEGRSGSRDAAREAYVRRAIGYMRQAYGNPALKMEEVAHYAFISTSYLTQLIRRETGRTFSELLTEIRMERAASLLSETDRKTYEISARCGFANTTYFSTVFKRVYGMTPTEYRKRTKGETPLEGTPNN